MILAIDTGNTYIVMGCISERGKISEIMRMETNRSKTEYEYAADMRQIFSLCGIEPDKITGAVISSVVPSVTLTIRDAVRMLTSVDALIVGAGVRTGLDIAIDDPGSIAPDLVATAVAAKEYYPLPSIIIDLGTATTVTVVDARGRFIGGAIMPGVELSMNALARNTSLLPNIEFHHPAKTIASNTADCMRSGIFYGSVGALEGVLDRFLGVLGPNTSIVATGGLASTICPHCRHAIVIEEDLLLKGLYLIWKKNRIRRRPERKGQSEE